LEAALAKALSALQAAQDELAAAKEAATLLGNALKTANATQQAALDALKTTNDDLELQLAASQTALEILEEEVRSAGPLQSLRGTDSDDVARLEEQLAVATAKLRTSAAKLQSATQQLAAEKQAKEELEDAEALLRVQAAAADRQAAQHEHQIAELQRRLAELATAHQAVDETRGSLAQQLRSAKRGAAAAEEVLAAMRQELADAAAADRLATAGFAREREGLLATVAEHVARVAATDGRSLELERQVATLERQLASAADGTTTAVAKAAAAREVLRTQLDESRAAQTQLAAQVGALEHHVLGADAKNAELERQLQLDATAHQGCVSAAEHAISMRRRDEAEAELARSRAEHAAAVAEQKALADQWHRRRSDHAAAMAALRAEVGTAEGALADATHREQSLTRQLRGDGANASRVAALEAELRTAEQDAAVVKARLAASARSLADVTAASRAQAAEQAAGRTRMQAELADANRTVTGLTGDSAALTRQLQGLRLQLAKRPTLDQVASLQHSLDEAIARATALGSQLGAANGRCKMLEEAQTVAAATVRSAPPDSRVEQLEAAKLALERENEALRDGTASWQQTAAAERKRLTAAAEASDRALQAALDDRGALEQQHARVVHQLAARTADPAVARLDGALAAAREANEVLRDRVAALENAAPLGHVAPLDQQPAVDAAEHGRVVQLLHEQADALANARGQLEAARAEVNRLTRAKNELTAEQGRSAAAFEATAERQRYKLDQLAEQLAHRRDSEAGAESADPAQLRLLGSKLKAAVSARAEAEDAAAAARVALDRHLARAASAAADATATRAADDARHRRELERLRHCQAPCCNARVTLAAPVVSGSPMMPRAATVSSKHAFPPTPGGGSNLLAEQLRHTKEALAQARRALAVAETGKTEAVLKHEQLLDQQVPLRLEDSRLRTKNAELQSACDSAVAQLAAAGEAIKAAEGAAEAAALQRGAMRGVAAAPTPAQSAQMAEIAALRKARDTAVAEATWCRMELNQLQVRWQAGGARVGGGDDGGDGRMAGLLAENAVLADKVASLHLQLVQCRITAASQPQPQPQGMPAAIAEALINEISSLKLQAQQADGDLATVFEAAVRSRQTCRHEHRPRVVNDVAAAAAAATIPETVTTNGNVQQLVVYRGGVGGSRGRSGSNAEGRRGGGGGGGGRRGRGKRMTIHRKYALPAAYRSPPVQRPALVQVLPVPVQLVRKVSPPTKPIAKQGLAGPLVPNFRVRARQSTGSERHGLVHVLGLLRVDRNRDTVTFVDDTGRERIKFRIATMIRPRTAGVQAVVFEAQKAGEEIDDEFVFECNTETAAEQLKEMLVRPLLP
jgi:predicted  nucleic acid-binding Zn-ribbon protein